MKLQIKVNLDTGVIEDAIKAAVSDLKKKQDQGSPSAAAVAKS